MYKSLKKLILTTLVIVSCSSPIPTVEDITGIWKSNEGASLKFDKNGEVEIKDFPLYLSHPTFKGVYNGFGSWSISDNKVSSLFWKIEITSESDEKSTLMNNGLAIELLVSRSGLGGSNSKITTLFVWKGDPDEDDRYEFYQKQEY